MENKNTNFWEFTAENGEVITLTENDQQEIFFRYVSNCLIPEFLEKTEGWSSVMKKIVVDEMCTRLTFGAYDFWYNVAPMLMKLKKDAMRSVQNNYEFYEQDEDVPEEFFLEFDGEKLYWDIENLYPDTGCLNDDWIGENIFCGSGEKLGFEYSNRFYKEQITKLTGVEFSDVAYSEDNCVYFFYCRKEDLEVLASKADEISAMVENLEGCEIALGIDPNGDEVHPAALLLALVVGGCACDYEGCEEDEEDSFNDMLSFLPLIFTKSVKKLDANNPSQRTVELTKREVEEAIGVTIEGAENFFNATADCLIRFEAEKALPDGVFCRVSVFESVIGTFDKHKQPFIQFIFSEPFMEEFICCEGLEHFRFGMDADWLFDEDESDEDQ